MTSAARAEQAVDFDEGNVVLGMIIDWVDLRGNKTCRSYKFQRPMELPGALVELNDRQLHENAFQTGIPISLRRPALERLYPAVTTSALHVPASFLR